MFDEAVDKLLRDLVAPDAIVAAESGPMPAALWSAVEANGLPLAAAEEGAGGVGARWRDCMPIARLAGQHAAPVPIVETLAVNWLVGRDGGAVVAGPASMGRSPDGVVDRGRFTGLVPDVAWGGQADHVLVSQSGALLLLPAREAGVVEARNMAGEPRDALRFDGVTPLRMIACASGSDPVLLAGAIVRTGQIAGALARLRDLCVDHARQRVQFGRPIARFQAVQHSIARLAEQAALASAAAGAAFACDHPVAHGFTIAAAKQVASEAAGEGAALAHAIVGAMGFTQEHVLHLLTRRLWAWRAEFGSARFWADAIGTGACALDAGDLWPALVRGDAVLLKEAQ